MRINTLTGTKEVELEDRSWMVLRYYLVQDLQTDTNASVYGIGIAGYRAGIGEEREWIPALTEDKETADKLLIHMMDGCVTPVSAVSLVDDLMGLYGNKP